MLLIFRGQTWNCAATAFSTVSVAILYDLGIWDKKIFLSAQMFCFELIVYINLLSEILYPHGLYVSRSGGFSSWHNYFLGYYNNHSQYFIPALLIAGLYMLYTGKRFRSLLLAITIGISALLVWSGGVLMALSVMLITYCLFKNNVKVCNYFAGWILQIVFLLFIILGKFQNLFRWLIDGILGKWESLELRMSLWDRLFSLISKHWLLGYGVEESVIRQQRTGLAWAMHAHNQILELLYQGGVIYFVMFIVIVIVAGMKAYKNCRCEENKMIAIAFLGWSVYALVEPCIMPFLMGMFVIAYHSGSLEKSRSRIEFRL